MKIGLPKEIKDSEYRVGLTPAGVRAFTDARHNVFFRKLQKAQIDLVEI
jgi:alanine dehydrogenase